MPAQTRFADRAAGRDVATRDEHRGTGPATLAQQIEAMRPEMARVLPKHMDPDRVARIALTVLRQTPALAQCTPQSFLGALMTASQLGLEPGGPLGESYLVPYGRECTFVPGYRGLVKLAWQSGALKSFGAHAVYERDQFSYRYGIDPDLQHSPALTDRGELVAVYAAAVFKDGGSVFEVMSKADVDAIRARSKAGRSGPWVTDYAAMAKKTVVKQLARWLPMATELRQAVAFDGTARTDVSTALDSAPVMPAIETPAGVDQATGEIREPDDSAVDPDNDRPADWPDAGQVGGDR